MVTTVFRGIVAIALCSGPGPLRTFSAPASTIAVCCEGDSTGACPTLPAFRVKSPFTQPMRPEGVRTWSHLLALSRPTMGSTSPRETTSTTG